MDEFFAGSVGGAAGVIVGHPLDTIKVKIQTQSAQNPLYKGTWDCLRKTVQKEGAMGLFRGVGSPLVGVSGINAVIFGVQASVLRQFHDQTALSTVFMSGVAAGFVQSFIASPVELAKTRMQIQADSGRPAIYKGCTDCIKQIYRSEGVRGVFKGQYATILREIPAFGTYFLTNEIVSRALSPDGDSSRAGKLAILTAGGSAGAASWAVCYPMDVLKSRIQSDGAFGPAKYNGIVDCLKKSVQAEGYGFLTRGLSTTIIRAFPTNAVTFFVLSSTLKLMDSTQTGNDDSAIQEVLKLSQSLSHTISQTPQINLSRNFSTTHTLQKVVAETQNALLGLRLRMEPLLSCDGECVDSDTYKAMASALCPEIKNFFLRAQMRSSFYKRGIVSPSRELQESTMLHLDTLM